MKRVSTFSFTEFGVAREKTHDAQGHPEPRAPIPQAETGTVDHHGEREQTPVRVRVQQLHDRVGRVHHVHLVRVQYVVVAVHIRIRYVNRKV